MGVHDTSGREAQKWARLSSPCPGGTSGSLSSGSVVYGPFRGFSMSITMGNGWKSPLIVDLSNENDGFPLPCLITRGYLFLVDLPSFDIV